MRTFTSALVLTILMVASAMAAPLVHIDGDKPHKTIVLKSDGATVEAVVKALGARFGFKVETVGTPHTRVVHGVYRGNLERILRRVLSQGSFVVIRDLKPIDNSDYYPAPPRRPHDIRIVKLIGTAGNGVIVHQRPSAETRKPPSSLSRRFRSYNGAQQGGQQGRPSPAIRNRNLHMGSES